MDRSRTALNLPGLLVLVGAGAGLLGCWIFPNYGWIEQDRRARCMSNLREIGLALLLYSNDNGEGFPNDSSSMGYSTASVYGSLPKTDGASVLGMLYDVYCPDPEVFACPTTPPSVAWSGQGDNSMNSYGYDQRHTSTHPADVALVSDEPPRSGGINSPNHYGDGQNVLFIDGHVEWCTTTLVGHFDGSNRDDIFGLNAYSDPRWDSWIIP